MKKYILALAVLLLPFVLFAGAPRIISVTMSPASPSYGDLVNIYVTACINKYSNSYIDIAVSGNSTKRAPGTAGQVYIVSIAGLNVHRVNPNITADEIGYLFAASNPAAANDCSDCGSDTDSYTVTKVFTVNMPDSSFFTSCGETGSLYLHTVMKDMYMGKVDWISALACQSNTSGPWVQPVPAKDFTLSKSVEGTLQAAGDKLLYKIDYSYRNGGGFQIMENIPAGFTVVSYGPVAIPGGSVTAAPPIVWAFPDMTGLPGSKEGTVWVLLEWDGTGTSFTNTATGSMTGLADKTASVTTEAGAAAIQISKTQSADQLMLGNNMTYYLSYAINGYMLKSFEAFEDASGVYSGGGAPPGWKSLAESSVYGTWTAEDPCSTGDKYITGSSTQYPGLLLDDGNTLNASDQFCDGMIVSDFMIGASTTFPGADAQIIFRNNGQAGAAGVSYGIVCSIDNAPSPGYLMLQKCAGGCSYPAGGMPSIGAAVAGKWYRMRINVTNSGGGQLIQAKIWARGDPEPSAWDISYTDSTALSNVATNCTGTGTWNDWRPGVNVQSGDYDDVLDSYDNFTVYGPRSFTEAPYVRDDLPLGITYQGCNGCVSTNPVQWNLPNTSFQAGSLTWWGVGTTCGEISNRALINGGSDIYSNWVNADIICWSPTVTQTVTRTFTITPTPSMTEVVGTSVPTNTNTITRTVSRTPSITHTISETTTASLSPTFTETLTATTAPTYYASCWSDLDGTGYESLNISGYNDTLSSPYYEMAVNPAGTPYISFIRNGTNQQTVLMWNGTEITDADGSGRESEALGQGISGNYDVIRIDPLTGYPAICYISTDLATGNYVTYKKWNGTEWCDAAGVPNGVTRIAATNLHMPSRANMDLDSAGNPHVVWTDSNLHDVFYLKWNGSEWVDNDGTGTESPSIYNNATVNVRNPQIVLANDVPCAAFTEDGGVVPYYVNFLQRLAGGAWADVDGIGTESIVVTDISSSSERTYRLKKDKVGGVFIAWMDAAYSVYMLRKMGGSWADIDGSGTEKIKVTDTNAGYYGWFDIEYGKWNQAHLVWTQYNPTASLYYLRWNGGEWVDLDGVGQADVMIYRGGNWSIYPRIGVDADNTPYVSCFESTGTIYDYFMLRGNCFPQIASPTVTRTATPTFTVTITPSYSTGTPTRTFTVTWTQTLAVGSPTFTRTVTPTRTVTATCSPVSTETGCMSRDASFGSAGILRSNVSSDDYGYKMVMDGGGKLVVGGSRWDGGMQLWRYNYDGTPDSTFNGIGSIYLTASGPGAGSVAVDGNGKIVAGGSDMSSVSLRIVRLNADGSYDTSFNGTGSLNLAGSSDYGARIAVDSSNRIVAVSEVGGVMTVWRFNNNGTIDTTFNGTGSRTMALVDHHNLAIDGSGKILITGRDRTNSSNYDMFVARINADGTMDTTFNGTGKTVHNSAAGGNNYDAGYSVSTDAGGRILVCGISWNSAGYYYMVTWRYNSDGTLDTSFNGCGYVIHGNTAGGNSHTYGCDAKAGASGIYVAGRSVGIGTSDDFVLWKYTDNGTLDTAFNGTGYKVIYNLFAPASLGAADYPSSMALNGNDIFIDGYSWTGSTGYDMFIVKYTDGCGASAVTQTPTRTFTVTRTPTTTLTLETPPAGTPTFTPTATFTPTVDGFFPDDTVITGGTGNEEGRSSCTDTSGNIYVAVLEWDDGCTCYVIYIYKYLPGGQLDTSFGTGGKMKCPGVDVHYSWNDRLEIKCDPSGRPVVVAYTDPCGGTCADMIIYRCTPIGVPDTTFNGTGYRICHNIEWTGQSFGCGFDIDTNNKLVCTGKAWNGTAYDMILVRCNEDGSIDPTFGTGGCVKYPSPVGDACGLKTKCHGGKIYTIGYVDEYDAGCSCVVRVMYIWCHLEDGTLDASFGAGGCTKYVNVPANHRNCIPESITITVGGKIVVIGSVDDGTACDITCKSMILWVFDIGGTPDTSFDGDGMLVSDPTGQGSRGNDVFVDDNGDIICGGTVYNGSDKDMCVWKYDFGGNPVTSFGGTGRRTLDTGNDEECMSILELMLCRKVASGFTYNGPKQYDVILWNIEDMCPSHTPTATMTMPPVFTDTPTSTPTEAPSNTCVCTFSTTITPTHTPTLTLTVTATPTITETIPGIFTPTFTPTFTVTASVTFTRTVTLAVTATATVTMTPPCPAGTPGFTVHLVYNPEHEQQDHVVVEITSSWPLSAPPDLEIRAHGTTDIKPVHYGTAYAVPGDTTGMLFRYLYPKTTGWGDIDSVLVSGSDICGQAGTSGGGYTKETISEKDVIVFKNLINPEKDERCRIVFKLYGNEGNAFVRIYNKNAALIKTLYDGPAIGGSEREVIWDGTNDAGQKVVSGMYVVVVKTDYYTAREKVAVIH